MDASFFYADKYGRPIEIPAGMISPVRCRFCGQARFAEAVVRTGRCGALVEFPPFTADEADTWCQERSLKPIERQATLAELYDHAG